jgi:hypothetical protein
MNKTRITPIEVKGLMIGATGSKHADMGNTPSWTNGSTALCILCLRCTTDCVYTQYKKTSTTPTQMEISIRYLWRGNAMSPNIKATKARKKGEMPMRSCPAATGPIKAPME